MTDALGPETDLFDDPLDEPRRSGKRRWLLPCCGAAFVFGLLAAGLAYWGASEFLAFGIATDYAEYGVFVEGSDLDSALREDLVARFESLRAAAKSRNHPGFFAWLEFDDAIRDILEDFRVTGPERRDLIDLVERLEEGAR